MGAGFRQIHSNINSICESRYTWVLLDDIKINRDPLCLGPRNRLNLRSSRDDTNISTNLVRFNEPKVRSERCWFKKMFL